MRRKILTWLLTVSLLGACGPSERREPSLPSPESDPHSAPEPAPTTPRAAPSSARVYRLGFASADVDTPIDAYLEAPGGPKAQCRRLNELVQSVCCAEHRVGCEVEYRCSALPIDRQDLMKETAYQYGRRSGRPVYAMHHGSVLEDVLAYLRALRFHGESTGVLPVGYTRHRILLDDEETKDPARKIDPADFSFHFLGLVLPGLSDRGGRRIALDYYATSDALLLSVTPVHESSLALAVAEYRSATFSLNGKQLTGVGARHLFGLSGADLVPGPTACRALSEDEPLYYRYLLHRQRSQQRETD